MRRLVLALTALIVTSPSEARAEDLLKYDVRIDVPVTLLATGGIVGSELWRKSQGVNECRWCGSNALDEAVRERWRWSDDHAANWASDIAGFGALPLAAAGTMAFAARREERLGEMLSNVLIVTESTMLAGNLSQTVKITVRRERPFVHALSQEDKARTAKPHDNNASFYSGHVSFAFALAVSSGTVATLRGYEAAPWVWGGGLAVAASVPYFRMAADRHYFTDGMAGAVVGSGVGFAVPYFFHRRRADETGPRMRIAFLPAPGGGRISAGMTW
ncbi:MAG: phosphatase PAP2 family protein [Nitrospirae bacterium]|nr:phosphatase PAP2 family protein [Nitrospirota bacterium]